MSSTWLESSFILHPSSFVLMDEGVPVRVSEPGESAIVLPWLAPGAPSLVALARSDSPAVWLTVRTDPGAVLLLARHLPPSATASFPDSVFRSPEVLETSLRLWRESEHAPVDWSTADTFPVHQAALAYAGLAEALARRAGGCDPTCAWIGGLLAPLGWLAVCAVDPAAVGECLREPVYADQFATVQRATWGCNAAAIGRRLARRWGLPNWLRVVVGHLGAQADLADDLGADAQLFRIVQLTVALARDLGHDLGLPVGTEVRELVQSLRLSDEDLRQATGELSESAGEESRSQHTDLLHELLAVAAERRRLVDGPLGEQLEAEVDRLQAALAAQRAGEAARLHAHKLRALAEFAAGAGHEINNPLAVISGHAQYMLNREVDAGRCDSLRAIIRQTERIHQILTELMQFARPSQPRRQQLDLRRVIDDAAADLSALAAERGVRLLVMESAERLSVYADPSMTRTAVGCLLRNAIEAAPRGGWARVSIAPEGGHWTVVVEDSGPGPAAGRRDQIFDPFYSGRTAGRGRGLGLPTAWRLARENGGDVRFEPTAASPARFLLALPICARGTAAPGSPGEMLRKTA